MQHHRWRLSVPVDQEEALEAWLQEAGASATYRDADPPHAFYAYFPPDLGAPGAALDLVAGLLQPLLELAGGLGLVFHDEDAHVQSLKEKGPPRGGPFGVP